MNYKDLLILKLCHLTEWKNEKEMIIPEEMCGDFGWEETCEFLGDGKYIFRRYCENGQPRLKVDCQNGQRHGFSLGWWKDGQPKWKTEYQNGLRHGKDTWWCKDGSKWVEAEYQNGEFIRN